MHLSNLLINSDRNFDPPFSFTFSGGGPTIQPPLGGWLMFFVFPPVPFGPFEFYVRKGYFRCKEISSLFDKFCSVKRTGFCIYAYVEYYYFSLSENSHLKPNIRVILLGSLFGPLFP